MPDPKALLAWARETAAKMKADGVPEADIDRFVQEEVGLSLEQVNSPDVADYLRAAGMGASFGFLDNLAGVGAAIVPGGKGYTEARDEVRRNYDAANEAATGADQALLSGAELAGGLALPIGAVGGLGKLLGMGAKAARATGVGTQALKAAAGGAAAGVGYGNPETLKEGAVDAGIGAAAGAAIPVGAGLLKGGVKWLEGMTNPGGAIRREARGLLAHTPDAEQILARQERLAPGTATVADISPEMTGLMSGVGADRATGSAARVAAEEGVEGLMQGIRNVQAQYEQVTNGVMLKATDKVLDVMEKYSKGRGRAVLAPNGEVHAKDVQMLRSQIRDKLRNTKKGWVKDKLRPDEAVLDKYLQSRLPAISKLDSDYKFLLGRIKAKEDLASTVTKSGAAHAKIRGYGKEPGSVGGSLLGSKLDKILGLLSPNQADRARAAQEYLMTSRLPRRGMPPMPHIPGGAFGVGSWGGQVGGGLLGEE